MTVVIERISKPLNWSYPSIHVKFPWCRNIWQLFANAFQPASRNLSTHVTSRILRYFFGGPILQRSRNLIGSRLAKQIQQRELVSPFFLPPAISTTNTSDENPIPLKNAFFLSKIMNLHPRVTKLPTFNWWFNPRFPSNFSSQLDSSQVGRAAPHLSSRPSKLVK